jgi:hypothetical protein
MKSTLFISAIMWSTCLVACDGPVEPTEAPESVFQNADGVTADGTSSTGDSRTQAGMAPYGQDPAQPRPAEDEEAASEATGGAVEGSTESPAVGSLPAEAQEEEEEADEQESPEPPPTPAAPKYQGSPATLWNGQGTSTMPKFGVNCRLATSDVFESATNGMSDDTIHFTTHSSTTSTLDIFVQDYWGETLNLNVDISRGLSGRSFRQATGTANYDTYVDIPVMDGTLCFQEKATPGADVLAEFSFILNHGGVYTSVAGVVLVPGDAISMPSTGLAIDAADELDIDLR